MGSESPPAPPPASLLGAPSWVSGYITKLCRSRLERLDPDFAYILYNLTACERQRDDLEFLTTVFTYTDSVRAAVTFVSCVALLAVLVVHEPTYGYMCGTGKPGAADSAEEVCAAGRARRRLTRLSNRGGHNRWLGICLVTGGACWFFFLLFTPALDLPAGVSMSDLQVLNLEAKAKNSQAGVIVGWVMTLIFSMAAGFLVWGIMGVNYTFPAAFPPSGGRASRQGDGCCSGLPGGGGGLGASGSAWPVVAASSTAMALLNVFYLNEMASIVTISPWLLRPVHWWILCAALLGLVAGADGVFVNVLLHRRRLVQREQQEQEQREQEQEQEQDDGGRGCKALATSSAARAIGAGGLHPPSAHSSGNGFLGIPAPLWALIGVSPPTPQQPPEAASTSASTSAHGGKSKSFLFGALRGRLASRLAEEPHFQYPVEILSISTSCAILAVVMFASAVEFTVQYALCIEEPERCRPETLELSFYGVVLPLAEATLTWLKPPLLLLQAANETATELSLMCQSLNASESFTEWKEQGENATAGTGAGIAPQFSSALFNSSSSSNSSFLSLRLCDFLTAKLQTEIDDAAAAADVREAGSKQFAVGLRYGAAAGYSIGFVVAIIVVINGLRSFKRLVKAVRLDLLKRQLIAVTRGIRPEEFREIGSGSSGALAAVDVVREKGYIPFAVYCFGYMLSSSLLLLVLLGTVLTILFALMAWQPFWAWLLNTWLGLIIVYSMIYLCNAIIIQRIFGHLVAPGGRSIPRVPAWSVFYNVFSFLQLANGPFLSLFRLLFLACSGLVGIMIFDRNIFPVFEFLDGGFATFIAMVAARQALEAKEQHPWRRLRLMIQSPVFAQYKHRLQEEEQKDRQQRAGGEAGPEASSASALLQNIIRGAQQQLRRQQGPNSHHTDEEAPSES